MAKDDYYVIVAKILVYLYKKLKGYKVDKDYITPMTKDFPIEGDYLNEVIAMMCENGYVKGTIIRAWGGDVIMVATDNLKITEKGIDYLRENSTMKKIVETLEEAKKIYTLFQ